MNTWIALLAAAIPMQDSPQVRSQVVGERTYIHLRFKVPADLRISRIQRKALDEMAPHDLAQYPRLVPLNDGLRRIAWHFNTGGRLEFLALRGESRSAKVKLLYPTENSWNEIDLTVDVSMPVNVPPPAKRNLRAPAEDDLEGRWAAAWERELAVRERLASDNTAIRAVRQGLARTYGIAPTLRPPEAIAVETDPATLTIPIREIPGIEPAEHPWRDLLTGRDPQVEPLARLVPAEFWYARLRVSNGAAEVRDRLLRWAGVAAGLWDGAGEDHRLLARYLRQLAFPVEAGAARFPTHVREMAVIGSDLHFRMGTDLTFLFVPDHAESFQVEMDAGLAAARNQFGKGLRDESFTHREVAVRGVVTADGSVRCYRATVGALILCSNSPAAVRRVIDVARRQSPSLAETPEFLVMRGLFPTDAPSEAVMLFFSEVFLREQGSPRHRILLRRRSDELQRRSAQRHAALFAAWRDGTPPRVPEASFSAPLVERTIDSISRAEDDHYREWREHYQAEFEPFLAPMAWRFQARQGAMRAETLIMAPRRANFWDEVGRKLGKGVVSREPLEFPGAFARLVMSFTPDDLDQARIKRWMIAKGVDKKHFAQKFEPLGDRVAVTIPDGPPLAGFAEHYWHADLTARDLDQSRSDRERNWRLAQIPATLCVEIAKPLIFQGMLKKIKEIVLETWPKMFTWETLPEEHRRIAVQRVQPNPAAFLALFGKLLKPEESPGVYLASGEGKLVIAPSMMGLKQAIDREIAPKRIRPVPERANAWLTMNLAGSPELRTQLGGFTEHEAHRRALGACVLRQFLDECGITDDAAALAWLGFIPASPDGTTLMRDPQRGEFVSSRHGSTRKPVLQTEPMTSSPWMRALREFGRIRTELHIRREGIHGLLVIEEQE